MLLAQDRMIIHRHNLNLFGVVTHGSVLSSFLLFPANTLENHDRSGIP
jgi:hypothetical protein